jgi:hypothetical protein
MAYNVICNSYLTGCLIIHVCLHISILVQPFLALLGEPVLTGRFVHSVSSTMWFVPSGSGSLLAQTSAQGRSLQASKAARGGSAGVLQQRRVVRGVGERSLQLRPEPSLHRVQLQQRNLHAVMSTSVAKCQFGTIARRRWLIKNKRNGRFERIQLL